MGDRSGGFGGSGGWWAGEVAVFEAVAVAFEGEDLGVVNEAPMISPQALKGLLEVTIRLARS